MGWLPRAQKAVTLWGDFRGLDPTAVRKRAKSREGNRGCHPAGGPGGPGKGRGRGLGERVSLKRAGGACTGLPNTPGPPAAPREVCLRALRVQESIRSFQMAHWFCRAA